MTTIKICGMANGERSPFDGQYVVEYDPSRDGRDPHGYAMICHLVCSPSFSSAKKFASATEAIEYCRQSYGLRPDGKPNRPLTALTVVLETE